MKHVGLEYIIYHKFIVMLHKQYLHFYKTEKINREESAAKHSTDDYSKFTSIDLKCFILLQVGGCVLYRVCRVDCFPVVSLQL